MKKIISIFMLLSLMLGCTVMTSAAENNSNDAIRADMVAYGMPEEIVYALPDSEIAKYANITQESITKHYYRFTENENAASVCDTATDTLAYTVEEITETECMEGLAVLETVQPQGTIKESYMATTINATPVDGEERRYLMSATYEWLSEPLIQAVDYFALTIDECMVIVPDTEYTLEQNDYVSIYSGSAINTHSWTDSLYASGIGGHCMTVSWLPDGEYYTYFNFRGYMSFEAEIAEVGSNGKVSFAAYITYAHKTIVPAINVSVSLSQGVSASITPTVSFDYLTDQGNWTHQE